MSKSTIFESSLSLVTIFYRDGEYFYNFVEGPDQGPYNEESEVYQEAINDYVNKVKVIYNLIIEANANYEAAHNRLALHLKKN